MIMVLTIIYQFDCHFNQARVLTLLVLEFPRAGSIPPEAPPVSDFGPNSLPMPRWESSFRARKRDFIHTYLCPFGESPRGAWVGKGRSRTTLYIPAQARIGACSHRHGGNKAVQEKSNVCYNALLGISSTSTRRDFFLCCICVSPRRLSAQALPAMSSSLMSL